MGYAMQGYTKSHRPATSFCVTLTGLSSIPTPLPKRGITNVSRVSAAPPFVVRLARVVVGVSMGLEKVHSGFPSVGSQAELIVVIAGDA